MFLDHPNDLLNFYITGAYFFWLVVPIPLLPRIPRVHILIPSSYYSVGSISKCARWYLDAIRNAATGPASALINNFEWNGAARNESL